MRIFLHHVNGGAMLTGQEWIKAFNVQWYCLDDPILLYHPSKNNVLDDL